MKEKKKKHGGESFRLKGPETPKEERQGEAPH